MDADHITAARKLKDEAGSRIAHPAIEALPCTDLPLQEGTPLMLGSVRIDPLFTPGHTDGHHAYRVGERVLTGDALLIDACGRTDFQSGDATTLYQSVTGKLFTLPDETLVYPGHDYEGRWVSSIAQEKTRNPRLGGERPLAEFVELMDNLDLCQTHLKIMRAAIKDKSMAQIRLVPTRPNQARWMKAAVSSEMNSRSPRVVRRPRMPSLGPPPGESHSQMPMEVISTKITTKKVAVCQVQAIQESPMAQTRPRAKPLAM